MTGGLSVRELAVLRGMAAGLTYRQLAVRLAVAEPTARWVGQQAMRKLGAVSMPQAVHEAHLRRLMTERDDCGDRPAYLRHLRRKEPPCWRCMDANAAHAVEQRAGVLTGVQGPQTPPAPSP